LLLALAVVCLTVRGVSGPQDLVPVPRRHAAREKWSPCLPTNRPLVPPRRAATAHRAAEAGTGVFLAGDLDRSDFVDPAPLQDPGRCPPCRRL